MKHSRTLGAALLALALTSSTHAQTAPPPLDLKAVQGTAELFTAIRLGDAPGVRSALDRGADINRPNWINATPLDWAMLIDKPEMGRVLIEKGAKLDAGIYGTPLAMAILRGRESTALELLDRGAAKLSKRGDEATTLMLAAGYSTARVIERLPQGAAELAKQDIDGATALIYAARLGKTENVQRLLRSGAKVDQADSHGRTPLMYAAMNGFPTAVDALLRAKASPAIRDKESSTALHLVARYSGSAKIAERLVKAGAGVNGRDAFAKTPLGLAQERRESELTKVLRSAGARPEPVAPTPMARPAIQRSVAAMEKGMTRFLAQSSCASCHHQGLGLAVLGQAAQRGFKIDSSVLKGNLQRIGEMGEQSGDLLKLAMTDPKMNGVVPTSEIDDFTVVTSYLFWALDSNKVPANPGLGGMAQYVASQQQGAGNWSMTVHRGPMQESHQTITALQVLGMRRFLEKNPGDASLKKARAWFESAPTATIEDRAARLLGLRWSGGAARTMRVGATELTALQNPDGGWSGRKGAPSDALTTGLALYSLRVGAATPASDAVVRKAASYLLRHQDESGAWYMNKTVAPLNFYFDGGFPGGESQYISFAATGWATLALMETIRSPRTAKL